MIGCPLKLCFVIQAPSIQEPDASAFSQILECSTASLAQPGYMSPEGSAQTGSSPATTPPQPASASEMADENEVLDWRDHRRRCAPLSHIQAHDGVQFPCCPLSRTCLFAKLDL